MIHQLLPNYYIDSVFDIDFEALLENGYKGIIFDIDSTLVPHGGEVTQEIDQLFEDIHQLGFKTLLLSNNSFERINAFNQNIKTQFIPMARKPYVKNYLKAVNMLGVKKSEVIVVGDQLFTDILGANLAGLKSILVHYLMHPHETKIGKKRRVESILSTTHKVWQYIFKFNNPFSHRQPKRVSEISPLFYSLAEKKETVKRTLQNVKHQSFAAQRSEQPLPNVVSQHQNHLIKTGKGIDPVLQENKAFNIDKAATKLNGLLIKPGEEFSFWHLIGKVDAKHGYKDGRVIVNNQVQAGTGGGLCNLANTINLLVIHSPLEITEVHYHSDALAPDKGERKPLANGTSVAYNYVDYRFKNTTDQTFQLCIWCEGKELKAELRNEHDGPYRYKIVEDNHRFEKEGHAFYRKSKIYKVTVNPSDESYIKKELLWDNKSEVMFDYDLIPPSQIVEQ
ncbi:YqeG family HAD IIIA-type phosphatase [Staphylococcus sp. 11261D007BR]